MLIRAAGAVVPAARPPRAPIFVLGSPRSGTTMLIEVLDRSRSVASLGGESHLFWELFHPLDDRATSLSHQIGPEDVTTRERRTLYWAIDRLTRGARYLDKSPRNALRVPYLHALFPDAWFVFLKRDGRAAVSSLITGWRSGDRRFPGTRLGRPLEIEGYDGANWKFLVPPGWERYISGHSLAEVCAFQWVASNEAILQGREMVGPSRWVELSYEDFVASPRQRTERLLDRLGLPPDREVLSHAEELHRHVTRAVSPPGRGKWRRENPREVESVLPLIEPTMRRLGYDPRSED